MRDGDDAIDEQEPQLDEQDLPPGEQDLPPGEQDLPPGDHGPEVHALHERMIEALLFASPEPLDEATLSGRLPSSVDLPARLDDLQRLYAGRGVRLVHGGTGWAFRTAPDLAYLLDRERVEPRKLSRAALETLAIIAYHQPVTRAEIEDIRGVSASKGTFDVLMDLGWIRMRGRRRTPGRPVTYGTTAGFLDQFGLETLTDLPGLDELKGAGFFEGRTPSGFRVPLPTDTPELAEDEDPLELNDQGQGDFLAVLATDEEEAP